MKKDYSVHKTSFSTFLIANFILFTLLFSTIVTPALASRQNTIGKSLLNKSTAKFAGAETVKTENNLAPSTVISNTNPIAFVNNSTASPYPSNISVSGLSGTISNLNVRLNNVSHPNSDDIDVLLVGPGGQKFILVSDAGGNLNSTTNVTVTFSDSSATSLPDIGTTGAGWGAANSTITSKPIDYVGNTTDAFPSPAPTSPYTSPAPTGAATLNGTFNGTNPNGTWSLYVVDDSVTSTTADQSIASGWSLDITVLAAAGTTTTISSSNNPSFTTAPNNSVIFTANVASASAVNEGTVSFTANGSPIASCSNIAVSGGQAQCTTTFTTEGSRNVVATYNGTANFATSNGNLTQIANNRTTVNGNEFCNTGSITVNDNSTATPYPSNIFVSGLSGTITDVNVRLNNVTFSSADDLDMLLVGPGGQKFILVSDAGGTATAISNVSVTFDDSAATSLPDTGGWGSGTVSSRPVDYLSVEGSFPSPAPSAPYSMPAPNGTETLASTFNGDNANGTWSLYVLDDAASSSTGSIAGGWCLTINSANATPTTTTISSSNNPSFTTAPNNSVIFTANVASASAVNEGTVSFTANGSPIASCSNIAVSGGQAQCTTTFTTEGSRNVVATYNGTANFATSNGNLTQIANNRTTVNGSMFCNTGNLIINDGFVNGGSATPYPSNIFVSGLPGTISNLTVSLNGVTHPNTDDLDLLLVGPGGQKFVLVSDAGGNLGTAGNVNITFSDASATTLADTTGGWGSGTVSSRPVNYGGTDTFPSPAPGGPYLDPTATPGSGATLASAFGSSDPNGTWNLYVLDDGASAGVGGNIANGWCLNFTLNAVNTTTTVASNNNPSVLGQNVTFTATVAAPTGTPTGSVQFFDGLTSLGTGILSPSAGGAQATFTTNGLSAGSHNITAVYAGASGTGGGGFNGSTSAVLTQVVNSPTISINDVSLAEGNSGTTSFTFTVSLSQAVPQTVTVNYATANNTATAGSDYTATSGTVTFNASQTSQTITVLVNGDTTVESNETFFVNLSGATNATILDNQGLGTIQNDDVPTLAINDVSQVEGNSGTSNFTFTVSLSQAGTQTVTVNYTTANNTATAGSDYTATSGTLTFAPGDLTKTFNVSVNGDTTVEPNETFFVNLTTPTNATILDNQGLGTIQNDDVPTLAINDVSQTEGNAGTSNFAFTVTLSQASPLTVSVDYATANNTATAGSDYTATNGTLTFAPGDLTKTINVVVNGDTTVELNETFFVNLTTPLNATILDNQGLGTIQNDDVPTLSVNDVSQVEGNSGTSNFTFTVSLSQASPLSVSVDYQTANGTATTANNDYTAGSGTLTFAPGDLTKTITVVVTGDTIVELNENFFINLTTPTNATIADNLGMGTIENDDVPTLAINDVSQIEGNSGTSNFTFTVSLSQASPLSVSVNYATANDTATTVGNDYTATNGILTFAPGETTKTLNVSVNGDTTVELNETFFVNLSGATNATILDSQGLGTIQNDDVPTLAINDVSQTEGNSGTSNFAFTVTLSQASPLTVSVDYATANNTATAGSDYTATNGTLTFAPGDLTKTINVVVNGDTTVELNETFFVNLTTPLNATILDNQGLGTIQNDDVPTLAINDVSQVEGNSGTSNFTFTVNLSQPSPLSVSVDYATANGTATVANNDYVAIPLTTVVFAPGETTKTVNVVVNGDLTAELNETFFVNLTTPLNATILDNQGLGTIQNDDIPTLAINDLSLAEGNSGTTTFGFTVTLSQASPFAVTVDYATANGTATVAGNDYTAASGTLTFAPNETTKTVNVLVNGDLTVESNETFFVNLTNPTSATISDNQGIGTIQNDDVPTLSINDVSQVEGNSGTSNFAFTITLSQPSPLSVSVDYATANGTATVANNDYVAIPSTTVIFAPGETTKTVNVVVNGDLTVESNETFFVNLTTPTNATILDNQGLGTIQNDDIPTLAIANLAQIEGNAGTSNFSLTVTLSRVSNQNVTVNYQTADGTATVATNDYQAASGTLTFLPGELTKTVTVRVIGDNIFEIDENFLVNLSNPVNATLLDGQAVGTILNDDSQSLRISDVRIREGNTGSSTATFRVTLTPDSNRPEGGTVAATVNYQTRNGTARSGTDYRTTDGTLTFAPGETQKAINVVINGDTTKEPNETFTVDLFNAVNAGIADDQAFGIIIDEDRAYTSDFDNDRFTDYSVYRPDTNVWYVLQSTNGIPNILTFGIAGDIITPGDYDGDGLTDLALFRPSTRTWIIRQSSNAVITTTTFGLNGDKPVQGDYDGDGRTDIALFRPSTGVWYALRSSNNQTLAVQFGISTDLPVQGDYDGDGKTDQALYRNGIWYILRSSDATAAIVSWGNPSDRPVSGDFDGDGRTDVAIYRNGEWWILNSLTGDFRVIKWGLAADIPSVGDFDGDGTSDIVIFRPSEGNWYVLRSTDNNFTGARWGLAGDIPLPAAYLPQ